MDAMGKQVSDVGLLIFDLDGTLIDSEADLARSVNATREAMGLTPLQTTVISSYVGQGVVVLLRRALGNDAPEEQVELAVNFFLDYYGRHMLDHTVTYPGVREALDGFNGRVMAVLTNKPVHFTQRILEGLGLASHFAFVYGGNSFDQKKPDPVGVLRLMRDTGRTANETMIVGDSETDVAAGRNAGVWTCGVTYGMGSNTLEKAKPDFLIGDLRKLPPLLATGRTVPAEAGPLPSE
jgi:phosphoglycolate phosphatase